MVSLMFEIVSFFLTKDLPVIFDLQENFRFLFFYKTNEEKNGPSALIICPILHGIHQKA